MHLSINVIVVRTSSRVAAIFPLFTSDPWKPKLREKHTPSDTTVNSQNPKMCLNPITNGLDKQNRPLLEGGIISIDEGEML